MGPWAVSSEEISDLGSVKLSMKLGGSSGEVSGDMSKLFLSAGEVLSILSEYLTLFPGDIIILGQVCEALATGCHTKLSAAESFVETRSGNFPNLGALRNPIRDERASTRLPQKLKTFAEFGATIGR